MSIFEDIELSFLKVVVNSIGQLSDGIKLASKEGFTSGQMLDYIYKNEPSGKLLIGKWIDKIYLNHKGWKDIRKRKENLVLNLKQAIEAIQKNKADVKICDIASGPAQYIIEAMQGTNNVTAELRDIDERWLEIAKNKAEKADLKVTVRKADALNPDDFKFEINPDIFVASGFYDWFNDREIVKKSMSLISGALNTGGYFVFSIQAGHFALNLTNKVFKDFNNNQLQMVTWDIDVIKEILNETDFEIVDIKADKLNHYPVFLARKK